MSFQLPPHWSLGRLRSDHVSNPQLCLLCIYSCVALMALVLWEDCTRPHPAGMCGSSQMSLCCALSVCLCCVLSVCAVCCLSVAPALDNNQTGAQRRVCLGMSSPWFLVCAKNTTKGKPRPDYDYDLGRSAVTLFMIGHHMVSFVNYKVNNVVVENDEASSTHIHVYYYSYSHIYIYTHLYIYIHTNIKI